MGRKKKTSQKPSHKWMIKNSQGLVKGPYQTRQILIRIEKKRIHGDEHIAPHSTLDWKPLTQHPLFYDKLLETLHPSPTPSAKTQPASPEPSTPEQAVPEQVTPEQVASDQEPSPQAPTALSTQKQHEPIKAKKKRSKNRVRKIEHYYEAPQPMESAPVQRSTTLSIAPLTQKIFAKIHPPSKKASQSNRPPQAHHPITTSATNKSWLWASALLLAGLGLWLWPPSSTNSPKTIQLLHPNLKAPQQQASTQSLLQKFKMTQKLYSKPSVKASIQAQKNLIFILQQSNKPQLTALAAAQWCLVAWDLAPYLKPTGQDLQAVDKVARLAGQLNPDSIEAKTCQSLTYLLRHQWQQADYIITDVLDQKSTPAFYYLKASVLAHLGQAQQAVSYLNAASTFNAPQKHKARLAFQKTKLMQQADRLAHQGNCAKAQLIYTQVFQKNKNIIAGLKGAQCLWAMGLSFDALKLLQNTLVVDKHFLDAHLMQVDFLAQNYNFKQAVAVLKQAYSANKKSYLLFQAEAVLALRQQNFLLAEKKLLQATKMQPARAPLFALLAQAYLKQNKKQQAYSAALKAVELNSALPQAQVSLAHAWVSLKGLDFGGEYLKKLQHQHPQQKAYPMAWARLLAQHKKHAQAQELWAQVVQRWPREREAYIQLALALGQQGQLQAAQQALWQATSLAPSDARPFFEAGRILFEARQYPAAQKKFLQALKLNPRYPLINYYLGQSNAALQNYTQALHYAKQEKQRNPYMAEPYLLAARVHEKTKNWSACVQQYTQAFKYIQPLTKHYIQITRCYRKAGHLELANKMLHAAVEKESGHPDIYKEFGLLRELSSEKELAAEAYHQYLELFPNAPDRRHIERRIQSLSQSP